MVSERPFSPYEVCAHSVRDQALSPWLLSYDTFFVYHLLAHVQTTTQLLVRDGDAIWQGADKLVL